MTLRSLFSILLLIGFTSIFADSQTTNNNAGNNTLSTQPQLQIKAKHPKHKTTKKNPKKSPSQSQSETQAQAQVNQEISANNNLTQTPIVSPNLDVVDQRFQAEGRQLSNPFLVSYYLPTYILPFYYTQTPYSQVYQNNTPDEQHIENLEFKYQFSFKLPLWQQILGGDNILYFGYTQLAFWQLYNSSPFFRETNYMPELFLANHVDWYLGGGWHMNFINFGIVHQSNGRGGMLERSWNRVYTAAIFARNNWMITVKPWYILQDSSIQEHNPDIADYLGYGQFITAYKFHQNVFSLQLENVAESGFKRGSEQLTWSFPMTTHLNGFIDLFSGYGQSLIEYNHYTNAVGVGISLRDWI